MADRDPKDVGRSDIGAVVESDIDPDAAERIVAQIAEQAIQTGKQPISTYGTNLRGSK